LLGLAANGPCSAKSLFDDTSTLEITLEGPLSTVIADTEERSEHAFSLRLNGRVLDVAVRMRGKSRAVHCNFPPLRLDFARQATRDSVFAGQNKLKLVTHCKGSAEFEENLLEEYAAYRILNVLTEFSFRARLLRIRYVDTDQPDREATTRYGFVIEPDGALGRRLGGQPLKVRDVTRTMLYPPQAALVYIFQFLIGNTDWSLVRYLEDAHCCHNGRLFSVGERNYYVPYDFDMSGLVNTRYAKPQPELRLRSVRIRRYRGYCTDRAVLEAALGEVAGQRDAILQVMADLPGLSAKNRKRQLSYLDDFFAAAENPDKLLKEFERRCL
jgi:hypothetical protein